MTAPVLRLATEADWWRYCAKPVPLWWVGMTLEDSHMLLGLGGVYLGTDGRFWAFFHRSRGVKSILSMQRAARTLFASLPEAGVKEVSALPDDDIEGSRFWLERLGFKPTDEKHGDMTIWTWVANV